MLFFKILYFCSISVAEGDTWTMEMFCTTILASLYEKWTEYEARWVLDMAGFLFKAFSLLTTNAGLWYAAMLIHMQKFL